MESWMDGAKPAVWWQHNPHPNSNRQSSGWHSYEKVNHRCGETGSVHQIFFPPKPPPLPNYLVMRPHHLPICFHTLPMNLIRKSILKTRLHKALGPDKIPNIILWKMIDILVPILHWLLRAIITTNYYLRAWWTWPQSFSRSWVIKTTPFPRPTDQSPSTTHWEKHLGDHVQHTSHIILRHNLLPQNVSVATRMNHHGLTLMASCPKK